jgi:hypothetical protein
MTTYRRSLPFKESPMKHSRRSLAASAIITLGLVGVSLPAAAKDGNGVPGPSSGPSAPAPKPSDHPSSSTAGPASSSATTAANNAANGASTTAAKPASTVPSGDRARQEVVTFLDAFVRKITASRLDAATKAALLARAVEIKDGVAAGTPPPKGSLDALRHDADAALDALEPTPSSSSSTPGAAGKHSGSDDGPETSEVKHEDAKPDVAKGAHPRERAQASLQTNIDKVTASNLPDDVKAKVIAALTNAKEHLQGVDDAADANHAADKVKEQIEKDKAARFSDMKVRMASVADRVKAAIDKASAVPGSDAAIAAANAALADARIQLDAATTPAELRAVWQALRVIRKGLPHLPEPTTTTSAPATTTAPATTVPEPTTTTTVVEATTTTLP